MKLNFYGGINFQKKEKRCMIMIPIRIAKRALTLSNPRWKQYLQNNRTKEGAMLEEIYMVRVSCKLFETGTSRREERNLEEFVNKTGRSPVWKRARRRGTIRTNRKLPKDHLFILVSAQTIVSYSFFFSLFIYFCSSFFVSSLSFSFLPSPVAIYHRPIRIRERGNGPRVPLLRRGGILRGRWMEWRRTMVTSDEKSREKFCNCQIWYFTLRPCIYCETIELVSPHTLHRIRRM